MMRITIDINGRVIGTIAAVRVEEEILDENTYEIYDVDGVDPGESVVEEGEKLGKVMHTYEDGAAALTRRVMETIETLP